MRLTGVSSTVVAASAAPQAQATTAPSVPYRPSHGLGVEDARRAVRWLAQDLVEHPPQVFVNRKSKGAADLLERGGRIRTGHDWPAAGRSPTQVEYMAKRAQVEAQLGIGGSGGAREIVYGSLQPSGAARDTRTGRFEFNVGADTYGPVALVLEPAVLRRSTFAPDDTFNVRPGQVGTWSDLPSVILDSMSPARVAELAGRPRPEFLHGVREHLRTMSDRLDYIEVQVPAPTVEDVQAVRIDPAPWASTRASWQADIDRLHAAAADRGIVVLDPAAAS